MTYTTLKQWIRIAAFLNTGQHSETVGRWCICQLYLPVLYLYLPLNLASKKYILSFFSFSMHTDLMFYIPLVTCWT